MTKTKLAQRGAVSTDGGMLILVFPEAGSLRNHRKYIFFFLFALCCLFEVGGAEVVKVNHPYFFNPINQSETSRQK